MYASCAWRVKSPRSIGPKIEAGNATFDDLEQMLEMGDVAANESGRQEENLVNRPLRELRSPSEDDKWVTLRLRVFTHRHRGSGCLGPHCRPVSNGWAS